MQSILAEIQQERQRQDAKFGENRNYTPAEWLMVLGEEVGEANKAALEHAFNVPGANLALYREELIQVAAVAVAAVENYDRVNKPKPIKLEGIMSWDLTADKGWIFPLQDVQFGSTMTNRDLKVLLGKKTRLTIEVLP